jgi:hypothetical protein
MVICEKANSHELCEFIECEHRVPHEPNKNTCNENICTEKSKCTAFEEEIKCIDFPIITNKKYEEIINITKDLMYTINCVYLDMGGNDRFVLNHKSHKIIKELKYKLTLLENDDKLIEKENKNI